MQLTTSGARVDVCFNTPVTKLREMGMRWEMARISNTIWCLRPNASGSVRLFSFLHNLWGGWPLWACFNHYDPRYFLSFSFPFFALFFLLLFFFLIDSPAIMSKMKAEFATKRLVHKNGLDANLVRREMLQNAKWRNSIESRFLALLQSSASTTSFSSVSSLSSSLSSSSL